MVHGIQAFSYFRNETTLTTITKKDEDKVFMI
jgi:hypothetical protein